MITGGNNAKTSAEILHVNGSSYCTLPNLPDERVYHTQNMMTPCGGYNPRKGGLQKVFKNSQENSPSLLDLKNIEKKTNLKI